MQINYMIPQKKSDYQKFDFDTKIIYLYALFPFIALVFQKINSFHPTHPSSSHQKCSIIQSNPFIKIICIKQVRYIHKSPH